MSVKRYTALSKMSLMLVTETNPELMSNLDDIFIRATDYAAQSLELQQERADHNYWQGEALNLTEQLAVSADELQAVREALECIAVKSNELAIQAIARAVLQGVANSALKQSRGA